jgi:hypothetical protein
MQVDDPAGRGGHKIEQPCIAADIAHERFGLDLFTEVRVHVAPETARAALGIAFG